MEKWEAPKELAGTLPRKVTATQTYISLVVLFIIISAMLFVITDGMAFFDFVRLKNLQQYGVDVKGTVIRRYILQLRHRVSYSVEYEFGTLAGTSVSPSHKGTDTIDLQDYNSLALGSSVPVIYSTRDAGVSKLDLRGTFKNETVVQMLSPLITITAVQAGIGAPLVVFFGFTYRRQKLLLTRGAVAAATLLNEREYQTKYGAWASTITYSFVDSLGQSHTATGGLPSARSGDILKARLREQMMSNLTVVYDPDKPSRNILYPSLLCDVIV